jgi:uncharacterized protein YjdB
MRFAIILVFIVLIVLVASSPVTFALMEIPIIGLTIDHTNVQLELGKTKTLSVTIRPDSATNKELIWSSSNPRVVEVNAMGSKDDNPQKATIAALAGGTATVTARTIDGDKRVQCLVTVTVPVRSINVIPEKANLDINEQFKLSAELEPADATEKRIIWESADGEVASVLPDGTVVAKKTGQVNIIARSLEDKAITDFSVITVTEFVADPVNETESGLDSGEEEELLDNEPEFADQEDSEESHDNEQDDKGINYLYIVIGALVTLGIIIVIFIVNRR